MLRIRVSVRISHQHPADPRTVLFDLQKRQVLEIPRVFLETIQVLKIQDITIPQVSV